MLAAVTMMMFMMILMVPATIATSDPPATDFCIWAHPFLSSPVEDIRDDMEIGRGPKIKFWGLQENLEALGSLLFE